MTVADTTKDPGRLVKSLRDQGGLSQEKFAAKLGDTFSSVNRWENGHRKPSPLAMKQIESILLELGPAGKNLHDEFFNQ